VPLGDIVVYFFFQDSVIWGMKKRKKMKKKCSVVYDCKLSQNQCCIYKIKSIFWFSHNGGHYFVTPLYNFCKITERSWSEMFFSNGSHISTLRRKRKKCMSLNFFFAFFYLLCLEINSNSVFLKAIVICTICLNNDYFCISVVTLLYGLYLVIYTKHEK